MRTPLVLIIAAGAGLLGGCGSDSPPAIPEVASLSSAPTARPVASERPLIREDASEAEKTRLRDLYIDCLWANGFPKQGAVKGPNGGYPSDLESFDLGPGVAERIHAACAAKEPESPFGRAERLDPQFADHVRANVKCLNANGLKAVVQDGRPALVDGLPSRSKGHLLDDCERQAFAGFYSTLD